MKDYTVYSTIAYDRTIRMALHPMWSAPNMHPSVFYEPTCTFPFRVVFIEYNHIDKEYDIGIKKSCRGKDVLLRHGGSYIGTAHENDHDAAMRWLMVGELND